MTLASFTGIFAWLFLLPVLYLSGARLAAFVNEENGILRGILQVTCGLGVFASFLILVGSFHLLKPTVILIYAVVVLVAGFRRLPEFLHWVLSLIKYLRPQGSLFQKVIQLIFLASTFFMFGMCLLPEIAHDALSYQLNISKLFARQASIHPWEYDLNTYMPLLMNIFYSVGLLFDSVPMAKLFHYFCGFFLTTGMMIVFDRETRNKTLAVFFATMFWLTPVVVNQLATTYVDVAATFFVFFFFYCFAKGVREHSQGCFAIAGFLLGLAVSTKFLLLVLVPPAYLVLAGFICRGQNKKQAFNAMALFSAGLLLGCGYWFARNALLTGNPFYPYLNELLGLGSGEGGMSNFKTYWNIGVPKTLINFILIPWYVTFRPDIFSIYDWVGPFYFLALPFLFFARNKKRYALQLFFILSFSIAFFLFLQVTRYLMVIFPIYLWAAVIAFADVLPRLNEGMKRLAKMGGAALALLLLLITCYHYRFQIPPLLGIWNADDYLMRVERSYGAAQWVNANLPAQAVVLNAGEVRQFYFNPVLIREVMLFRRTNYPKLAEKGILTYLKGLGVTHVLRAELLDSPAAPEARIQALDCELLNPENAALLTTLDSQNKRESRFRYRVYQLKEKA